MPSQDQLLKWARSQATTLQQNIHWGSADYWVVGPSVSHEVAARATAAIEFLRRYAGPDSEWSREAQRVYSRYYNNNMIGTGARAVSDMLLAWAEQVEAGVIDIPETRAHSELVAVSTDLLGQVRRLHEDRTSHPAAAIMLAGAGAEIGLRAVAESRQLTLNERPSLTAWARLLRTNGLLSSQDVKDVEQIAGLRNAAAHGHFDELSRERAGLMEQQVNFLIAKLDQLNVIPRADETPSM